MCSPEYAIAIFGGDSLLLKTLLLYSTHFFPTRHKEQKGTRDSIVKGYQTLASRSSVTIEDIDKDIHDLLKIMDDVKNLSVDTGEIRAGLDELLAILQRRWALA